MQHIDNNLTGTGTSIITVDPKGEYIRLPIGNNGEILTANSASAAGQTYLTGIVHDRVSITTTSATPVVGYTFSPPLTSSWTVFLVINAVESTLFAEAACVHAIGGFYRTGVGAPAIIGAGIGMTDTIRENFTPNIGYTLNVNGNNVELRLDSGGVQNVRWLIDLTIIKNN